MKNLLFITLLFLFSCSEENISNLQVKSKDNKIVLNVNLVNNEVLYDVAFEGKQIINASRLGFEFKNQKPLSNNLKISKVTRTSINNTWTQVWGEQKEVKNEYNEALIELVEKDGTNRKLNITFRVFNDGIGFSYEIPKQKGMNKIEITNELTEFNLTKDLSAWFIPANFDSYEELYSNLPASKVPSANTPITFESKEKDLFMCIHEANLTNYAGMTLKKQSGSKLNFEANLVPWPDGVKVKATTPMKTPWRTIQISNTLEKLAESMLILNLNEPNKLADVSWIKPNKYVGIWWGMHIGTQTWTLGNRHGATTKNMKALIDFAAANNIPAVLAEGWNTGWENWGKPKAFDFITPYADFDLKKIVAYAKEKNIALIGHHETGGDTPYYEEQMDKAFKLYHSLGIHQLKTGYAGPIIPSGNWHHGQYMVNHYRKVVETAAKYEITVNAHEPIKATGIRRTYPNMMAREGARGMEWNGWSDGNPPEHHTILPFTRIMGGPLDYTPGTFDLLYKNAGKRVKWNSNDKGTSRVNTTLAKQLALYVVFYSPLQMASDLIKNYEDQPAFQFIKDVPVNWEKTKFLQASIGNHVVVARKDWDSADWYLGAITDEISYSSKIKLDFLEKGKNYIAEIYKDAKDTDWKTNPYPYEITKQEVTSESILTLNLAPGGGQAIRFSIKQ